MCICSQSIQCFILQKISFLCLFLLFKETADSVVYHSTVEPTAVNRDIRRYNLHTMEKVMMLND